MKPLVALAVCTFSFAAAAQDLAALTADTKRTVLPVVPKVVNAMQEAVAEKGVAEAIPVCKEQAPRLIQELKAATGWSIRRVSQKLRNPERATPDAWEQAVLAEFDQRAAAGEKPEALEKSAIVDDGGRATFRYMKALPVADVCLNCHGPADGLDPGVRAMLQATYPRDQAVGYARGQIRGALTVKRPL